MKRNVSESLGTKDSYGSRDFDGLLIQIIGVRLREAQTEKVQVCLGKNEFHIVTYYDYDYSLLSSFLFHFGHCFILFQLRGALKPEEVGFEAARVTDGFKAYAVDFEVLRLAEA